MAGGIYCAINPETSRERESKFALRPAKKSKVLIAGGGIAGMHAAITAAESGHEVILCEKTGRLGGGIRVESEVPFKVHVEDYIKLQERSLKALSIDLRMNTVVDADLVKAEEPDVLIAAIGATPIIPPIEGIESAISAQEAYASPELVGENAVIIGGGLVGAELAIYLDMLGRKVALIEMGPAISASGNRTQGSAISMEMRNRDIKLEFHSTATRIADGGVYYTGPDGEAFAKADTAIYATGQKANTKEAFDLACYAKLFYAIGDCSGTETIFAAVKNAYTIARSIGRYS
jgi:pyruvate/2-oxoglutarate dehydrogenase complex dihydrolipoamide dehydrogenase (E3) component